MHCIRPKLLSIILIFNLVFLTNIDLSLANPKPPSTSYPSHSIKFFIPHTITLVIFSSSPPNPSLYFQKVNDFYLLPSPSINTKIPSLNAYLLNEQFKYHHHQKIYIETKRRDSTNNNENKLISLDNNDTTNNNDDYNNNDICKIPQNELEERDLLYLISQNVTKSYIKDKIQNYVSILTSTIQHTINDVFIKNIKSIDYQNMVKLILSKLTTVKYKLHYLFYKTRDELTNIYHFIINYQYHDKIENGIKGIYDSITKIRHFIISIEKNQCNELYPYLKCLLPSYLPSIAVQEICAILLIGICILFVIISIFIAVWLWYKNMINQYLNDIS